MNGKIINLIPFGQENAITRKQLMNLTGFTDRIVRSSIEEARKVEVIVNLQDGRGYFRPLESEYLQVREYYLQERSRVIKIMHSFPAIKRFLSKGVTRWHN